MSEKLRVQDAIPTTRGAEVEAASTVGRRLGGGAAPPPRAPMAPRAPGGMLPAGPGGATPFAKAQAEYGSNIAPSSENSRRVVSIVFALGFTMAAAVFAALCILLVGLYQMGAAEDLSKLAGLDKKEHVRDTGTVEERDLTKRKFYGGGGAGPASEPKGNAIEEMFGGLGAAPVTVYTQGAGRELYSGIEIICDQVGYRKRAALVKDKAHIAIVPAARCRLVFQGNVPLRTWVTGGDTVRCTFNPIVCRAM